jgi:hypothetical protein
MDVLTLILACSVYPDDSLVRAMVELASQGNPHFVGDMLTLATFDKTTTTAAANHLVTELTRQGGRPVVGLMGIPPGWAERYGRARSELYDGCVNIWVGTAVLSSHHEACVAAHAAVFSPTRPSDRRQRVAPPEAVRLCALRRFGADLGVDGYAEAINRLLPQQRLLFTPAITPTMTPAPDRDDAVSREARPPEGQEAMCRCRDEGDLRPPPRKKRSQQPAHLAPILD